MRDLTEYAVALAAADAAVAETPPEGRVGAEFEARMKNWTRAYRDLIEAVRAEEDDK